MKIIMLLGLLVLVFISGCSNIGYSFFGDYYQQRNDDRFNYAVDCIENPNGYWNSDEKRCEDRDEKIRELFGRDGCLELKYVEIADLSRYKDYVVSVNGGENYSLQEFELYSEENITETEYIRSYKIELNTTFCKSSIIFYDFQARGLNKYEIRMPYCKNLNFRVCEK